MSTRQSPAPHQSSVDGKIFWDQGTVGSLKSDTINIAVSPTDEGGRITDIQSVANTLSHDGGGVLLLRNGTYALTSDLVIPDGVSIVGETALGAVIDFQNDSYQVIVEGTLVSDVGTVSATNSSTAITGTDTIFGSSMVGSYILISGIYYLIVDVTDSVTLEIEIPFEPSSVTDVTYLIAETRTNVLFKDVVIQNSSHADGAVSFRYVQDFVVDGCSIYDSILGFNFRDCWAGTTKGWFASGCTIGFNISNCGTWTLYDFEAYANDTGLLLDNFVNASIANFTLSDAVENNITLTNSSNISIYDFASFSAGAIGIEVSDSYEINFNDGHILDSASDAIKLTTNCDRCTFDANILKNSGGFGINIADSASDSNVIIGNIFNGNVGTINNSGTNTLIRHNIPASIRISTITSSATPTINTDITDFVYITAQAADITSFTSNLSGTPVENQLLWISITGTASRAITWGASFEASLVALPTTTVSTNRLDVGFVWNTSTSKWRCIAVA